MKTITKQEILEDTLDNLTPEMAALVALMARKMRSDWKVNSFIRDFTHSMGIKFNKELLYLDIAVRIVNYMYPKHPCYWYIWDKIYSERVDKSCLPGLIKHNNQKKSA
jgi:hypothetical protein